MTRTSRKMSQKTKDKIARALSGKPKSIETRKKLSISLKNYWSTIPAEDNNNENEE